MLATVVALAAAAVPSTAVGVGLDEFNVALYRARAPAGVVRLNVTNRGEDPHDLAVRNSSGKVVGHLDRLGPGDRGRLRLKLKRRGTYTLFCTIADHESLGMRARLRITTR